MTRVSLERDGAGRLVSCKAEGHARFAPRGHDVVCAAVTILLRAAMRSLSAAGGAELSADTSERGRLAFYVAARSRSEETDGALRMAADFLEQGFLSLAEEFPRNVEFTAKVSAM